MSTIPHEKIVARMDRIDKMPKEIRELIHEHGLTVVQSFLDHGVTSAKAITHLIKAVRTGSIDPGIGTGGVGMINAGRTMCVVPMEPTIPMIAASMATVTGNDVLVDKEEKHRRRLRAAIKAGMARVV